MTFTVTEPITQIERLTYVPTNQSNPQALGTGPYFLAVGD